MDVKNLFPIGSVVHVKDSEKKMMIIGILQGNGEAVYDYLAVLYPEGYLDSEHMYLFNHEDVDDIDYLGFMDAEMQLLRSQIKKHLSSKA